MSYGTNGGYIAYWAERGVTITTPEAENDAARLIATTWLDARFRSQYPGWKYGGRDQLEEWPRYDAYDREGYLLPPSIVPREIEWATYELARQHQTSPGSLFVNATMGKAIKSVSVSGAVSVEYAGAQTIMDLQISIPIVDALLAPILTGAGSVSSLSGSVVRV